LLQTASVPPLTPAQDQVDDPPQDPGTRDFEIPTEQAYRTARLHEPSTGHGGLSLVQLVASVQPSEPRHDQVDDPHPQDHSTFADGRPLLQENWVALSQEPLVGQTGLVFVQFVALVHEYEPRHDQVDDPPQEPELIDDGVPTAQPNCAALLQVPLIGHGSRTILHVSLVCHERVQFQVDACPQVRLSGSGDT
jgi:hypothetical protein